MKSRVQEKIVRQQLEEISDELYKQFAHSISYQTLATAFWVLHRDFGFGAERLKRLKDSIEDEFRMMETGVFGKKYTTTEPVKWCKSQGIDFDKSQFK